MISAGLAGAKGTWGGVAKANRRFNNAVFWIPRTGAPWGDLPCDLGDWRHTPRRFIRWRDKGLWEPLLERPIAEPDYAGRMREARHGKVQPHAGGAVGGNQAMSRAKGGATQDGVWPWMRTSPGACRPKARLLYRTNNLEKCL